MTIQTAQSLVELFHKTHGFPVSKDLFQTMKSSETDSALAAVEGRLEASSEFLADFKDVRAYRVHLLLEEAGEYLHALRYGDEIAAGDAIGDLLYLLLGEAVTWNLPAEELLQEVINSNASKQKRDPETNPRMRDKGPNYRPPDIKAAIERGRARRKWEDSVSQERNEQCPPMDNSAG